MKHGFFFPSTTEQKTWSFASQRYLLKTTVEKTPADVGFSLSSLSSPSTLQRKLAPYVFYTTISISTFQRILVPLCLWLIIFWGLLISLVQFKGTKRMKRLCQSSSEQCFSRIIFCALCSYEGAENKAGSEAVRTIALPEKNNNDAVHFHAPDLDYVAWWSFLRVLISSWNSLERKWSLDSTQTGHWREKTFEVKTGQAKMTKLFVC